MPRKKSLKETINEQQHQLNGIVGVLEKSAEFAKKTTEVADAVLKLGKYTEILASLTNKNLQLILGLKKAIKVITFILSFLVWHVFLGDATIQVITFFIGNLSDTCAILSKNFINVVVSTVIANVVAHYVIDFIEDLKTGIKQHILQHRLSGSTKTL